MGYRRLTEWEVKEVLGKHYNVPPAWIRLCILVDDRGIGRLYSGVYDPKYEDPTDPVEVYLKEKGLK